ncbi:hypothetical protein SPRG_18017 [Saprolegnia parasitica CBS 223.65]|uniref:Ankyrin repeat domain-containing protein n=1 Tax=Saprolegnia parasitica (strain CBS 223.65) TaxID=695850 RepID=A0A067BQ54_SAPPC|nr:hypothetical protein SPRG_18017 [Saprolegnia parasitica CBS 223.65]KDO16456.1 hypothetical protein SPRG_18017 [Saprolegnia parasitica CBS 223.65]|eukprot:XP_012212835.1 hypothetical protein SPRG_18017 [Saprolegnia parasitica CBS 223.65]
MAEAVLRSRGLQLVFVYQDGLSHDVVPLVRPLYATAPDHVRDRAAFAAFDARFRAWLDAAGHDRLPPRRVHVNRTRALVSCRQPDMMARATYRGHLSVAHFLHEAGVRGNNAGALIWAHEHGHLAIAEYLHTNGLGVRPPEHAQRPSAHPLVPPRAGFPPIVLDIAASQDNTDLLVFVIEANVTDLGPWTLETAARFGHAKAVLMYLWSLRPHVADTTAALVAGTKRQHPLIVEYLQQRKRWRRP